MWLIETGGSQGAHDLMMESDLRIRCVSLEAAGYLCFALPLVISCNNNMQYLRARAQTTQLLALCHTE